jgi:hypothetical protein
MLTALLPKTVARSGGTVNDRWPEDCGDFGLGKWFRVVELRFRIHLRLPLSPLGNGTFRRGL